MQVAGSVIWNAAPLSRDKMMRTLICISHGTGIACCTLKLGGVLARVH